jgi:DnaK suppressor protein
MELNKEEIKQKITQEIEKTKVKIINLEELTKPIAPDCAIGRVSRMDAINNKSINENALRKAQNKLKGMEIALQNVDDKNFGLCARCNNQIPLGRILLMPHSRFCVHCAN